MSTLIKPPPDSTYRARIKKLQGRIFDRTDLGGAIPWKWCAFVAIVWLAFGAFNWLVLLDKTPIKDHQRLAFMYGPAMLITDAHKHLSTADKWALLYFLIPVGLIAGPPYLILNNKKAEFAGEARSYAADQGRVAVSVAAQKLKLQGAGIPFATLKETVIGIAQGADLGHVGVFCPSRGGKGLHLTCTLQQWTGAAVVVDPKSEQYERTAALREAHGPIYRIGPHCIDLLDFFRVDNPLELRELFTILMRTWQDSETIFSEKAFAIFEAAHLVAKATNDHMLRVLARWTTQAAPEVMKEAYKHAPGPIEKFTDGNKDELNRFASSAWGTFTAKFSMFVPFIDTITTRHIPPSWAADNATIYICYTLDELSAAGPLVTAIVAGLIKHKRRGRSRTPMLCAIDELRATALPDVDKYLAEVGGAGIVMLLYIQDMAQLRDVYGPNRATTIIANMHHQIYYKPEHEEVAAFLATKFGTEVEVYRSGQNKEGETNYNTRYRTALEQAQITSLPPSAVLVFSRGIKVLGERMNCFNSPETSQFAEPPGILLGSKFYQSGRLVLELDSSGFKERTSTKVASAKPTPPNPAPVAVSVSAEKDEELF